MHFVWEQAPSEKGAFYMTLACHLRDSRTVSEPRFDNGI